MRKGRLLRGVLLTAGLLSICVAAIAIPAYRTAPRSNVAGPTVDVLLVLGSPTGFDGKLTEMQRWRVDEAVREYRLGRGPRILFSGGQTCLQYREADTMAAYARQQGIPSAAVFEERDARTTMQNIANSQRILDAHGWHSVEVISSPEHLPRAALLLALTHLLWRVHGAPTPGRGAVQVAGAVAEEAIGTAAFRLFGPGAEPVLHAVALVQHKTAFGVRWVYYKVLGGLARV